MYKNNYLISSLLCSVLLFLSVTIYGQKKNDDLTFEEALQLMKSNNPALLQAKEQIRQKEYERRAKNALYMPRLSLNAKAISMSESLHLDLTPVRDAIVPLYETLGNYGSFSGVPNPDPQTNGIMPILPDEISTQAVRQKLLEAGKMIEQSEWDILLQDKNFASVTADFLWPIFTGGKIYGANKAAGINIQIADEKLKQTEAKLTSELATRYYGLVLAKQVADVRRQSMEFMKKHHQDAKILFENGMIAKLELLHASVSLAEAEREHEKALRNVNIVESALKASLNVDSLNHVNPSSPLFINENTKDTDYWYTTAIENNPQLMQIAKKRELLKIKHKVSKGEYLPNVALMGTYNLVEKNLSPHVPEWMLGVGLKWTIFNGFERHNKIKSEKCMMDQVDYAEEKAFLDLEAYLTNLNEKLNMYKDQKVQLEKTLDMTKEYLESTEEAFNQGMATSLSVVDAQLKIAQVEALILKTMYEYDVTLVLLHQTAGVSKDFKSVN